VLCPNAAQRTGARKKSKKPTITIVMVRAKKSPVKTGLGEKKGRG
jgi:hypothetical protein